MVDDSRTVVQSTCYRPLLVIPSRSNALGTMVDCVLPQQMLRTSPSMLLTKRAKRKMAGVAFEFILFKDQSAESSGGGRESSGTRRVICRTKSWTSNVAESNRDGTVITSSAVPSSRPTLNSVKHDMREIGFQTQTSRGAYWVPTRRNTRQQTSQGPIEATGVFRQGRPARHASR